MGIYLCFWVNWIQVVPGKNFHPKPFGMKATSKQTVPQSSNNKVALNLKLATTIKKSLSSRKKPP
jgi:hypothetical protein